MTLPKAYLREMKAKQARLRQIREFEASGNVGMVRMIQIKEKYEDPENPMTLFLEQMKETMRRTAIELGVCDDCLAKFPDPLA